MIFKLNTPVARKNLSLLSTHETICRHIEYQPEKMQRAALAVLEKEPKVHSMAINEMRDEVRKILKEKEVANNE